MVSDARYQDKATKRWRWQVKLTAVQLTLPYSPLQHNRGYCHRCAITPSSGHFYVHVVFYVSHRVQCSAVARRAGVGISRGGGGTGFFSGGKLPRSMATATLRKLCRYIPLFLHCGTSHTASTSEV
jgi:hypothetical protein